MLAIEVKTPVHSWDEKGTSFQNGHMIYIFNRQPEQSRGWPTRFLNKLAFSIG